MSRFCSYTFLTVLTVDLLAASGDITLTWTSPVLPKLYSNDSNINPLNHPITSHEESWIASLLNIGALIGPLPFGLISKKIGRRISLLCISIPHIISFTILAFVGHVHWYYFARFFAGISVGASCSLLPLYIAEIAEDSNRGRLSVTLNIFWSLGKLLSYVLGPYLSIMWFNLALACVPILFFVLFIVIAPESPYYLVSTQQVDKAEESLMKLRSQSRNAVEKEISFIQSSLEEDKSGTFFDLFKTKRNVKALTISLMLIAFQQLSGVNAVLFYTQLIFNESGSTIPADVSSIIIGLILFSSSIVIPFIADKFGRRVFLTISSSVMMVSLAVLGLYFFLKEEILYDVSTFSWLPILCLVFFIIGFNTGMCPMPWTVSSELFPINLKPIGAGLVSSTCWIGSFLTTKFFNDLNDSLGKSGTFWLFSGFCFLALLFTLSCVPETKGKNFKEIQEMLGK